MCREIRKYTCFQENPCDKVLSTKVAEWLMMWLKEKTTIKALQ